MITATPRAHVASTSAPAPSWRFGFSALAGSLSRDVYALDNVVLQSASLIGRAELPLAIAINGQQFLFAPAPFIYYGPADWPRIDYDDVAPSFRYLGLSPTSGPVEGGTVLRVAVRGAGDLYNLTLLAADPRVATLRPPLDADRIGSAHLSAYRCFLGGANVTAHLENETVP